MPDFPPIPDYRKARLATSDESKKLLDTSSDAARIAWDKRLSAARTSIPKKFDWVPDLARSKDGEFVIPQQMRERLPWLTSEHVTQLWDLVKTDKNIFLCGPFGTGKTTVMVMIARWYLRLAEFDHPKIQSVRHAYETYLRNHKPGDRAPCPPDPDDLREVCRARWLRFVSTYNLLMSNQRDVDDAAVESAQNASVLLLDEVGEELASAERGKFLSSSRSPAVTTVIKERWNRGKRTIATTPYVPEELEAMYEGGTFRRLVEDESGAKVIDLSKDEWAGAFIRERDAKLAMLAKPKSER